MRTLAATVLFFALTTGQAFAFGCNTFATHVASSSTQFWSQASPTSALTLTGDITIEAWVKVDQFSNSYMMMVDGWNNTGGVPQYRFSLLSKGLQFDYADTSNNEDNNNNTTTKVPLGKWTHVAVTFAWNENKLMKFYINGQHLANQDYTGINTSRIAAITAFIIGEQTSQPTLMFNGSIDDVRIYNYVRTGDQINADYRQEVPYIQTGLVGYWPFDNNGNDVTYNNNNLTNNNTATFRSNSLPFTCAQSSISNFNNF